MLPNFLYPKSDHFIILAQVEEGGKLQEQPEFEVPEHYTIDEAIQYAGRNNFLVRLTYQKTQGKEEGIVKNYQIEPYSYRDHGGKLFLFAYDIDSGHIKAFRTDTIHEAKVLEQKFIPRWIVEL